MVAAKRKAAPMKRKAVPVLDPVAKRNKQTAAARKERKYNALMGIEVVKTMRKASPELKRQVPDKEERKAFDIMFGCFDWS